MQKELGNTDRMSMADIACEELLTCGMWDWRTKCKNFIKKYILGRKTAPEDLIFWPSALLALAVFKCRNEASPILKQKMDDALLRYFERWEKRNDPIYYPDDLLSGETFLAIYEAYAKGEAQGSIKASQNAERYKAAVDKLADFALTYPADETGSLPYRAEQENWHIYVDSIGLMCPFLYEYGRFNEEGKYMELAVKQIANFLAYGMDTDTGLPYHGYDIVTGTKYGIIGWGRAAGWLLRGMTGCMTTEYGRERIEEAYKALTDSVIKWQRKDGYFSWQLQALEGPADTSATGMICLSLQEGIKMGVLDGEAYENALEKGLRAMRRSIKGGRVYDCSGECEGFSQYPQKYGAYPWAMAPALMLDELF